VKSHTHKARLIHIISCGHKVNISLYHVEFITRGKSQKVQIWCTVTKSTVPHCTHSSRCHVNVEVKHRDHKVLKLSTKMGNTLTKTGTVLKLQEGQHLCLLTKP